MIDAGNLAHNPVALLAAAVVVLWVARALANIAFKIVLVLAAHSFGAPLIPMRLMAPT